MTRTNRRIRTSRITMRYGVLGGRATYTDSARPGTAIELHLPWMVAYGPARY